MSARRRQPNGARPYPGPNRFNLNGEAFAKLLEDLKEFLHEFKTTFVDSTKLRSSVSEAILYYDADLYVDDYLENLTLHELEDTLLRVIEILKREANEHPINIALGATSRGYCDIEHGIERRKAVISALEKIAAIPPPATRRRGRPKREALYRLVHRLANYWSVETGWAITSNWHKDVSLPAPKKVPQTAGAQFVYAIANFVDPEILPAVPKMMETVVAERNRGIVMPWLNVTPGN